METGRTPQELREGVRSGILAAVQRDVELRGSRTARLLVAAGALGVFGAISITLLLSAHLFGHHASWHPVVFSAVWSGLLIVSLALAFLQVRTPALPLARSACVGLLGLGVAGTCGWVCPDPHFLHWWFATGPGARLSATAGAAFSVLCFGLIAAIFFGLVASVAALGGERRGAIRPLLPALAMLLLLAPGIALQSVGTSLAVFAGWLLGTAAGSYTGVAAGIRLRRWFAAT